MHVSPGTGTTFVPFRFFARPEVTELVLRPRRAARCNNPPDGRALAHLGGHPRELRGRRRARDRGRARARRRSAPAPPRRQGGERRTASSRVELHLAVDWGVERPAVGVAVQERVAEYLGRMADLDAGDGRRDRRRDRPAAGRRISRAVPGRRSHARARSHTAPSVCRDCVWWQSRGNRTASKERWIERVEEESGEWGTIYYDDDGSVLGSMQYGPAGLLPARGRPPGRPALGRRGARHLRVPDRRGRRVGARSRSSSPRSARLATRARRRSRRSRTATRSARRRPSASSSTAPSSRATSSRTSGS